ncbi:hypothetical protein GMLC_11370 [Geomonas limicola]|uniref:HEAT repeat domain-containing protein n=1 Tax=Geomonas limicola TaxID=2740186 RepID=A0A6V8N4Q6_9BACT|nr:HEAT repeat domain-containing protein [Geomonas limicola]GFO67558.1 hypothetical protein GMLC_11370 [Geomonas limicola]
MHRSAEIDTSLQERRDILALIGRVRHEGLSIHEMEEIGRKFQKAGRRALRPLVRELWRENSGDLISKYAYILDFFETESWLDQLIQIALKRRDLGADGKAALQIILEGYGVDLTAPVFQRVFGASGGSPLQRVTQGALQLGEDGIVTFLDEFLGCPAEIQQVVIRELAEGGDPRAARMLEAMLWHEDRSMVLAALAALGGMRDPMAAAVLSLYLTEGKPENFPVAERSLRRLRFLGIAEPPPAPLLPFHAGYATPPDGDGYRSLMIARWVGEGRLAALYLQVHERRGLLAAWGGGSLTEEQFDAELDAFGAQDDLHRVTPEHVIDLLRDALYHSGDLCYLPADFYLRRSMFAGVDLTPLPYRPAFPPQPRLSYRQGEEIVLTLFADPFFAGWFIEGERVCSYAGELRQGGDHDEILSRFCTELITPHLELIRERLLASADLMRRCGREHSLVSQVVALAQSLEDYRLPHHLHPFLRGFALESMEIAGQSLDGADSGSLMAAERG